jgi:Flp pilus assembly protein TadD
MPAMLGLGNSYYVLGDLKSSETAFRRAAEAHPREGAAFNNLAHVLLDLGRRDEALAAARRAVALGGPLRSVFQQTLEEIESTAP